MVDEKYLTGDQELRITIKSKENNTLMDSVVLKVSGGCAEHHKHVHFEADFSPGLTAVLEQQLNSCSQLLEFEPDSKCKNWFIVFSIC